MTFAPETRDRAARLLDACRKRGLTLGTVESCTGGLIAGALTAIPGSSDVVMAGFITYANAAKTALAGVPAPLLAAHGAVSEPVARAMAEGGRARLGVDLCVAVTGVAGPGGGSEEKPVGLVWLAVAGPAGTIAREKRFGDIGRDRVRGRTVDTALDMLIEAASAQPAAGGP